MMKNPALTEYAAKLVADASAVLTASLTAETNTDLSLLANEIATLQVRCERLQALVVETRVKANLAPRSEQP